MTNSMSWQDMGVARGWRLRRCALGRWPNTLANGRSKFRVMPRGG